MAFPTTGVLDDFDRANGSPGANWSAPAVFGSIFAIDSNQASAPAPTNSGYWNPATFGPDSEAFMTFSTISGTDIAFFYVRLDSPGATANAYGLGLSFIDGLLRIYRVDSGSFTQLGANQAFSGTSGDKFGMDATGTTLTAWKDSGGGWASVTSRTDGTYTSAGNIAFELQDTATRGDDFGGGTVVVPAVPGEYGTFRTDKMRARRTSW